MLLIQASTPLEFESLRQIFKSQDIQKLNGQNYFEVTSKSKYSRVIIYNGGMGSDKAYANVSFAIETWKPKTVLDYGTAGSLVSRSALELQDKTVGIISCTEVIKSDKVFTDVFASIPVPTRAPISNDTNSKIIQGKLLCIDYVIDTIHERERLHRSSRAIAVCWEAYSVALAAQEHGCDFFSLRALSDFGDDSIEVEYSRNASSVLRKLAEFVIYTTNSL